MDLYSLHRKNIAAWEASMRRSYPLHDLSNDEFEQLAAAICHHILGTGTIVFAPGPDGGRDAKFVGCATKFPSERSPLQGKFIIQAKHTSNPVASISDSEFNRVIQGEIPRIEQLVKNGELEHYMLMTNRKCPANAQVALEAILKGLCSGEAHVTGIEQIRTYLTLHPDIGTHLGFDRFERTLTIQISDLTTIIHGFHAALNPDDTSPNQDFDYVAKSKKNKINKMTDAYYKLLLERSLPYFSQIESFLKNPRNEDLRNQYEDTADEIRRKLICSCDSFTTFDEALTHIIDQVTSENEALRGRRRLAAIFLHYMYFTCDVGQHADAIQTS